jgi:hypothetical protein
VRSFQQQLCGAAWRIVQIRVVNLVASQTSGTPTLTRQHPIQLSTGIATTSLLRPHRHRLRRCYHRHLLHLASAPPPCPPHPTLSRQNTPTVAGEHLETRAGYLTADSVTTCIACTTAVSIPNRSALTPSSVLDTSQPPPLHCHLHTLSISGSIPDCVVPRVAYT